jgi:siroheme synthase
VPYEIVPGVTAGTAAPAAVGVPVTHRDITRGAIFVTGHARGDGELDLPWPALAQSGFTLVFFMGVATIGTIAQRLVEHGLGASTPALVVQEATTRSQRHVVAELASIEGAVKARGIRAPAVFVVGQVAGLAEVLGSGRAGVDAKEAGEQAERPVVADAVGT